jgi:hypothetical protein
LDDNKGEEGMPEARNPERDGKVEMRSKYGMSGKRYRRLERRVKREEKAKISG